MTAPVAAIKIPQERLQAEHTALTTLVPVGEHISKSITTTDVPLTVPTDAQFLKLQAITCNIRYRIDGGTVGVGTGFQLAAGSDVLIPVAVSVIHIIGESAGTYQAQWCR